MNARVVQFLLGLSLLLNCFVLAGFVYRSWIAPPEIHERMGGPSPPGGSRPGGPVEMMADDLKLDQSQRQALRDVFEKNTADRRERFHAIQQVREQIGATLKTQPIDRAQLDSLVEQVAKLRVEQQKANLHGILDLDPQLTPQQRERMHKILADRYIGGGPQPGRPGGPGRPPGGPGPGRPPQ